MNNGTTQISEGLLSPRNTFNNVTESGKGGSLMSEDKKD